MSPKGKLSQYAVGANDKVIKISIIDFANVIFVNPGPILIVSRFTIQKKYK